MSQVRLDNKPDSLADPVVSPVGGGERVGAVAAPMAGLIAVRLLAAAGGVAAPWPPLPPPPLPWPLPPPGPAPPLPLPPP